MPSETRSDFSFPVVAVKPEGVNEVSLLSLLSFFFMTF